jgi:hypothetical protein
MPISRSLKRGASAPAAAAARPRLLWPFVVLVMLALLTVAVVALPASLVKRILPPAVGAEDFSGSLWHGSAGRITVNAREAGAVEWRLHPWPLLNLTLSADLHWVKIGYLADATADIDRAGLTLRNVTGGGPAEDLRDLGVPPGWQGATGFEFTQVRVRFTDGGAVLASVIGDLKVANLTAAQIAEGADLGGYALHLADGAITPDADASAELNDTGGPLEVKATIHFSGKDHLGLLSGTIKERADAAPALRAQLQELTQLHARDAQGRIPVELEFTL